MSELRWKAPERIRRIRSYSFEYPSVYRDGSIKCSCKKCGKVIITTPEKFHSGRTWHYCEDDVK